MTLLAQRALVVVNRSSGENDAELSAGFDRLREQGMAVSVHQNVAPDEFGDFFKQHGAGQDLAIIGGGDGTLNAAAAHLVEHGLPLAILPLGTANDLARTLSIPFGLDGAFDVILAGRLHAIDLGKVNDRLFFNIASLGLGAQVPRFHKGERKRRWRVFSYVLSIVDAFKSTGTFRAKIVCDGRRYRLRCIHIAVGNGRHYGGGMTVAEDAAIDDEMLDLYVLRPQSLSQLVFLAPALRWGTHGNTERTIALRGTRILVETRKPQDVNADGEIVGRTPAEFTVVPKALRIIVPSDYASPHRKRGKNAS